VTLLRLADDLAATDSIKTPSGKGLRDNELKLAARLVDGLAGPWKPEQYKDQYAANLSAIIAAKIKGKGAKPRLGAIGPGEPKAEVADLMERLRQSLSANTNAREKPPRKKTARVAHRRAPPERGLPIPSPREAGRGLGRGVRPLERTLPQAACPHPDPLLQAGEGGRSEVVAGSENGRRVPRGEGIVGAWRCWIRMSATARSSRGTRASTGCSSSA
jgi:hypothetical protein